MSERTKEDLLKEIELLELRKRILELEIQIKELETKVAIPPYPYNGGNTTLPYCTHYTYDLYK